MKRSLPLGIDIGQTRLRIASALETDEGVHINAVVTRECSSGIAASGLITDCEYVGALIDDARMELQTKEKRCIIAVGEPDAVLRTVEFPAMTETERLRAAFYEARRYVTYPFDEALVRVHPVEESKQVYALGVVRRRTLYSRLAAIKSAGLRPLAVDHESLALARALPGYDAILDIGFEKTSIHITVSGAATPVTLQHNAGGAEITRAIERDLSIDSNSAEKRKRILGTAGAGAATRSSFLADLTSLLEAAGAGAHLLRRIGLVGNGARLSNFAVDLERATGLLVELPASAPISASLYPPDVVKASAPDWNLAVGLATWGLQVA